MYALACFRAGAEEVEVVYQFLEAPDDVVSASFSSADVDGLERELGAAIARIREGDFRPTPSAVRLLRLPGARPRVRRAGARWPWMRLPYDPALEPDDG